MVLYIRMMRGRLNNLNTLKNITKWILSVLIALIAIAFVSDNPLGLTILIPSLMINPLVQKYVNNKFKFKFKWWMILIAFIVTIIIGYSSTEANQPKASESNATASHVKSESHSSSKSTKDDKTFDSIDNKSGDNTKQSDDKIKADAKQSQPESANIPEANIDSSPKNNVVLGSKLIAHYINVGQGDSEFIVLPNNQTMLIDAGDTGYGNTVVSYIKGLGYTTIDYLIATHPHADHIGGMAEVVNSFEIKTIYMPKATATSKTYENLLTTIQNKGLTIKTAKAGVSVLSAADLKIDMLAPNSNLYSDLNNYSAVIKITYGSNKLLFMGDAEVKSENQITSDVSADVVKVGHHGSDYSSGQNFVNKVHAKYAIISVGKNSYGHPSNSTITKWQAAGASVYRTDESGNIVLESDGTTITISGKLHVLPDATAPPVIISSNNSTTANNAVENNTNPNNVVYVTNTGTKYHRDGCSYLKSKIQMNLTDAVNNGYEPCSRCNPPTISKETETTTNSPPVSNNTAPINEANNAVSNPVNTVVYGTNTGSKYHRAGCSYLKSSIEMSLGEAINRGLEPCSRCNPPTK